MQAAVAATHCFERRSAGTIFQNPLTGELSRLDFVENTLHFGPGFLRNHAWSAAVVTVLGSIGHAVSHIVQTTLVEQVDDQFQFMQAFEVGHFRLVSSVDQCFKGCFDQFADAATEDDLFTEEIGFGFLGKRGLDDAPARAANSLGVRQAQLLGFFAAAVTQSDQAGNAATPFKLGTHQVTWPFWRYQQCRYTGWCFDLSKVDVEAVRAHDDVAFTEIPPDVVSEDIALHFVGEQDVD